MSWIEIGHVNDIPLRGARKIRTPLGCVAIFRTGPEEIFAATDLCPHKGGPLSEGIVHGQNVTCPLHNWVFDLNTGAALGEDASIDIFPVRVEAGKFYIDGSLLAARSAA